MNRLAGAKTLVLTSMLLCSTAWAVQVVGDSGSRNSMRPIDANASSMRDDSNAMATGVIDAIDADTGRIVINAVVLRFDPASVLVFSSSGTRLSPSALHSHQNVGFLLDRKDPAHPAVRVLYLK